jgi:hypothetical protein
MAELMAVSLPGGLATALTSRRRSRLAVTTLDSMSLSGPRVRLVRAQQPPKYPRRRHRGESRDGQTRPSPAGQSRIKPTR